MKQKINLVIVGAFLFCVGFSVFAYADQPGPINEASNLFLGEAKEVSFSAHGVLDIQNLEDQHFLQKKYTFLKNENLEKTLGEILNENFSQRTIKKYSVRPLDKQHLLKEKEVNSEQIILELIYDFRRLKLNSESYVIGAIYTNIWRPTYPELNDKHVQARYVPSIITTQHPVPFIFKETDAGGAKEINAAIKESVEGFSKFLNSASQ